MSSNDTDRHNEWQSCNPQVFWGEIAPCEHVLQIYEDKGVFLDMLEGFAADGFSNNDCVIVIATDEHLHALNKRLKNLAYDTNALESDDQYIPINAGEMLNVFMRDGWPDETLFNEVITKIICKAHAKNRNVRAFGEMVALLWAQGHNGATVQLEHLWNKFCEKEAFSLFCAYPKSGFTQSIDESLHSICCSHSKIISGIHPSDKEIFYKPSTV